MLDLKAMPTLRANMLEFIKSDPVSITLTRPALIKTDAGGWIRGTPQVLTRQMFRLVPFKRRLSESMVVTTSGTTQKLPYVFIGKWNADVRRDDEFDYNGDHYRVVTVEPKSDDRTNTDRVVVELEILGGDKAPPVPPG